MDQVRIGAFLKALRKEKELTQEQLAERLRVSGRTVSRWETGSNMPDIAMLVELAEFYDVSIPEIINGERKSENMDQKIKETAVAYSVAYGTLEEIETVNILEATYLAMNRAIEGLSVKPDFALIDGNRVPRGIKIPCETIVKGDSKSMSVAAASVLAKVTRDRLMLEYDKKYPEYNFKKHKGYGTKEHTELIKQYGPCEIHRLSFLKNILG